MQVRYLPCTDLHHFHVDCVDQWLEKRKCCPLCKKNIDAALEGGKETPEGPAEESQELETLV